MRRLDADSVVTAFLTTEGYVTHLERDEFVPDNIIFSITQYERNRNWERSVIALQLNETNTIIINM